jgi:hypothetical protein
MRDKKSAKMCGLILDREEHDYPKKVNSSKKSCSSNRLWAIQIRIAMIRGCLVWGLTLLPQELMWAWIRLLGKIELKKIGGI